MIWDHAFRTYREKSCFFTIWPFLLITLPNLDTAQNEFDLPPYRVNMWIRNHPVYAN